MDKSTNFLKHSVRIFAAGIKEGTFLTGMALSIWPALFFLLYGLAIPLSKRPGGEAFFKVLNFFPLLPLLLVFYQAAMLILAAGLIIFSSNRKLAIGILYGGALTFILLLAMALIFSIASFSKIIIGGFA